MNKGFLVKILLYTALLALLGFLGCVDTDKVAAPPDEVPITPAIILSTKRNLSAALPGMCCAP